MEIADFLGLLGGLALFLYGMQMMSSGLEDAAGNRMKEILEKLTANRFLGVAVGALITAVIQSSSATTVMVVGFVNSGMMTLRQAVWIIMGANIGTTITGQLIALDVDLIAPLFAFVGVAMIMFVKITRVNHIGRILAGLGVLFIGMDMMGAAMVPLRESEAFIALMTRFSNPVLGILAGALFTAVIQSSSASVGILQTLAAGGLIPFSSAVYVLFGQNIGTCITAVIAAIGTSRNAKRTTAIHLMFNVFGTIIFTALTLVLPLTDWVASLTPGAPAAMIANMHTIFNITTTALLLPLGGWMATLAEKLLPGREEAVPVSITSLQEYSVNNAKLGYSAVHMDVLRQEIDRLLALAAENMSRGYKAVLDRDLSAMDKLDAVEEEIDVMNKEISQFISKILIHSRSGDDITAIESYFLISGNAERIGDHAANIGGYVKGIHRYGINFSQQALGEIREMQRISREALDRAMHLDEENPEAWMDGIEAMEQQIDDMTEEYRERHLQRMRQGLCSEEACILYSEMLTDFERIGDHVLNIAEAYAKIAASGVA